MMSKFPGSDHSCRRRYVALLLAERIIIIIIGKKNKETRIDRANLYIRSKEFDRIIIRTRYTSARQYVKPYEKKQREQKSQTATRQSADIPTTRCSNQVGADATVGRLSNNCFPRYQAIGRIFKKSWTVTRQWLRSRDRRPTVKQRF